MSRQTSHPPAPSWATPDTGVTDPTSSERSNSAENGKNPRTQRVGSTAWTYEQFKDRAEFLFVYIREAHPDSLLVVVDADGGESLFKIPQAADASTRTSSAAFCQRTVKLSMPIAVDGIDNAVGKAYAGWPNRMVVVGTDGKVVYARDPAPGGTNAERLSAWLRGSVPANR